MKLKNKKIIVIGLGLNGSSIVNEMINVGAKVIAIDSNDFLDKKFFDKQFHLNDLKYISFYKYILKKLIMKNSLLYENPITLRIQRLFKKRELVHAEKSLFFFNYAFKAINGRSNNWGRISPRFSKKYLLNNREIWPLKYEELLKYYKKIETKLSLSGRKEKHTSFNGKIIKKKSFSKLLFKIKNTILRCKIFKEFYIAPSLDYRHNTINPFLDDVMHSNNLEIIKNSICSKILCKNNSEIYGVEIYDKLKKEKKTLNADYVFLCSSPIETVKILLNSKSIYHKKGLGNDFNMVGKYFNDHIKTSFTGVVKFSNNNKFDLNPFHPSKNLENFYILMNDQIIKHRLKFIIHGSLSKKYNLFNLYSFAESDTKNRNYIKLSKTKKDKYGNKEVLIKFNWSKDDILSWKTQIKTITSVINIIEKKLNFKIFQKKNDKYNFMKIPKPGLSHHESGGAIMGFNKKNSVVNKNGKVWGLKNLFICDMSIFPSLSPYNPTLTSLAITNRTVEILKKSK